jgi:hypothetical protein
VSILAIAICSDDGIRYTSFEFEEPDIRVPDTIPQVCRVARWFGPRLLPNLLRGTGRSAKPPVSDLPQPTVPSGTEDDS